MKKRTFALLGTVAVALSMTACSQLKGLTGASNSGLLPELTAGYPSNIQNVLGGLDLLQNPSKALSELTSNYGVVLSQLAGLVYNSPEYQKVAGFNSAFVQKAEHANNAIQSLLSQFASDMSTEAQVFSAEKPSYGYPALPAENAPESAYGQYRDALVKQFERQVMSRMKIYHNRNFQNKFFNLSSSRKEVPGMLKSGDQIVGQYMNLIGLLTKNDKVCGGQSGVRAKAECFRQYLHLVAEYPTALTTGAQLLQGKSAESVLTPALTQSLITPVSDFVSKYVK